MPFFIYETAFIFVCIILLSLDAILNKEIEVTEEIVIENKITSKQIRLIQKLDKK